MGATIELHDTHHAIDPRPGAPPRRRGRDRRPARRRVADPRPRWPPRARSTIHGAHHVRRGYENIERKFLDLGARIERVAGRDSRHPLMKIGIDLGTANVLVYVKGKGIVIKEPSVVAVADDNRIVAVGEEAREMIGRTPGNIHAIRPMKDGVIADYVITEAMLRFFINKATKGRIGSAGPEVMICVPAGVTSVEKRAVRDAALKAGAKEAYLIEEPLAAAIGANVPISGPSGNMVIDIGGGTSEIAVIALGGIVVSHSLRVGGNRFDEAIATYIRKKYNLMIGERTAEEVKIPIGTALPLERELYDGGPRPRPDRRPAADDPDHQRPRSWRPSRLPLQQLVAAVRQVLEQTPPELSSRHHRQGHGHVRRRRAAAQHRQAADPGHRRAVPRRRERAQLRRPRHRPGARALRLLQEVARPAGLTWRRVGRGSRRAPSPRRRAERRSSTCTATPSASFDSLAAPGGRSCEAAATRGLTHLAITDHDRIDGALEARELRRRAGLTVIVGEEIKTARRRPDRRLPRDGDPAGPVGGGDDRARSASRAASSGIPHPFDRFRGSLLRRRRRWRALAPLVDWVEAQNARLVVGDGNERAAEFAQRARAARRRRLGRALDPRGRGRVHGPRRRSVDAGRACSPRCRRVELVTGRATLLRPALDAVAKLVKRVRGNGRVRPARRSAGAAVTERTAGPSTDGRGPTAA